MSEPDENARITRRFLMGRARDALTEEERRLIEGAITEVIDLPPRKTMIRAGETVHASTYLIEGYACRYMDDRDGHRQFVAIHVAGDFIDLHGYALKKLDHDIATIGPARVATFDHRTIADLVRHHPNLTRLLWFSTLLDAALHREWIFRLGRLDSAGRVAHFFCELNTRLEMVGLARDDSFELPFTQAELAEACGVTGVHVNRTLRMLRERGLMTYRDGVVRIDDRRGLCAMAEFDAGYLYPDSAALLIAARETGEA